MRTPQNQTHILMSLYKSIKEIGTGFDTFVVVIFSQLIQRVNYYDYPKSFDVYIKQFYLIIQ